MRDHLSFWGRGVLSLLLIWAACSAPLPADDAAGTTYDRNTPRDWTDVSGNTITGRFSGVIRDEVLINVAGRVQRVRLSTLSETDIAWLWGLHNQEGKLNQLPPEYREKPVITEPAAVPDDPMPAGQEAGGSTTTGATTEAAGPPMTSTSDAPAETAAPEGGDSNIDQRAGRTWTINGSSIEGQFSGIIGTEVRIKVNNRVQGYELSDLSSADLAWIWDVYNALGKLDDLPVEYRVRPEVTSDSATPGEGGLPSPAQGAAADLRETRTWTDRDGNVLQGSFASIHGDEVSIHRGIGNGWFDVHLAQLARGDLVWLQDALRAEGRLNDLPLVFRDPPDERASDSELTRQRRQGGVRQWKLYNGQTFVGAYDRVQNGIVQIYDNQNALREEHWNDLSDDDHAYLKERLARETPAEFFPQQRDLVLSPEDQTAGMRIWTDRERNQIIGSFTRLTSMDTVAVFTTPGGEARYIYEYLSGDDQAIIQGVTEQQRQAQLAQQGASGGSYSSNGPGYGSGFPSGGHGGAGFSSGIGMNAPGYGAQNPGTNSALETLQRWQLERQNADDLYCRNCGTTFKTGVNGMHFGAECPVCRQRAEQQRQAAQASQHSSGAPTYSSRPPTSVLGPGRQDTSAYDLGAAQGALMGKAVWAVIGVVCLVLLIRKVSR